MASLPDRRNPELATRDPVLGDGEVFDAGWPLTVQGADH